VSAELEVHLAGGRSTDDPAFYFDFGEPRAYLAAERILQLMPGPAEWIPVDGAALGAPPQALSPNGRLELERLGAERGLQRFVWPEPLPFESGLVLRAATYAKGIGRVVAFSLAAFRQCYAAGRSLADADNVVIAASACEMHPAAVLKGCELRSTYAALESATERARARGVRSLPAVYVPAADGRESRVFHGDEELEAAARELAAEVA
jgi:2-hydroxychromene-2-carboxylate isomerase